MKVEERTDYLSEKGIKNLKGMLDVINNVDARIVTDKEQRLATGLDAGHKLTFTDKGPVIEAFIKAYGIIMDYGANKYDYSNFEKAPYVYEDVLDCVMRHWIALCKGEDVDPESLQLHIGHIVARCAIGVMKAERLKYADNPEATRFIGWEKEDLEQICALLPEGSFQPNMFSPIRPKNIPFTTHVSIEMIEAVAQSPFFSIVNKYSLRSWCKTFETSLIAFIISAINGETEHEKAQHAKVLLWLAINIFYLESINKFKDHVGYLSNVNQTPNEGD